MVFGKNNNLINCLYPLILILRQTDNNTTSFARRIDDSTVPFFGRIIYGPDMIGRYCSDSYVLIIANIFYTGNIIIINMASARKYTTHSKLLFQNMCAVSLFMFWLARLQYLRHSTDFKVSKIRRYDRRIQIKFVRRNLFCSAYCLIHHRQESN